jgi:hypothetical protein
MHASGSLVDEVGSGRCAAREGQRTAVVLSGYVRWLIVEAEHTRAASAGGDEQVGIGRTSARCYSW